MKLPVSVVIPIKNEEAEVRQLISNLRSFEEILFVDNGSTDDTVKLVRKLGARVIHNKDKSFANLRQFGDDNATYDWVLAMDADMRTTKELVRQIDEALKSESFSAYKIGRRNIILGKEIKHTDWSPEDDCHIRFYKKSCGAWHGDVHELWQTSAKVGKMTESFLHYNYRDVEEYIEKINTYSELGARRNRPQKSLGLAMLSWALRDFGKRYIYKLGFLDGYHGIMLSYLQAVYHLSVGVKLYESKSDKK